MTTKYSVLIIFLFINYNLLALKQKLNDKDSLEIKFKGYIDLYYATDNDNNSSVITDNRRQLGNLNVKKNQFDLNTAQFSIIGTSDKIKFNLTLHQGALNRFAYEPFTKYNLLQEANFGVNLYENIWIEGGIFPTHIGSESFLVKDNWFSSHSIMTNFEPFYQEGFVISKTNENFKLQLWVMNGYGIFDDINNDKTIGYYLKYNLKQNFNFSISGNIGNELPIEFSKAVRYHNNFILDYKFDENLHTKLSIDNCFEKQNSVLGGSLSLKYHIYDNFFIASRLEYFDDKNGVLEKIINLKDNKLYGLREATGISIASEYKPNINSYIKFETRYLHFNKDLNSDFLDENLNPKNERLEIILNFGVFIE